MTSWRRRPMRGSTFAAAAAAMSALDMYAWADPSGGGMSPGQRRFHVCAAQYRRLQAGNQVGKSYAGAAEAWWAMTGTHPLRPAPPRLLGWIVLPDLQGDWPKISSKLRTLQPPGVLAERCHYDPVRGYMSGGQRCIELQSGASPSRSPAHRMRWLSRAARSIGSGLTSRRSAHTGTRWRNVSPSGTG